MWTAGTIVSVGLALGWVSPAGAVAVPGEPTASECQIIAQQAVNKGVTFEAELVANGGGVCPTPIVLAATVKPAVVVAATIPAAGLPKSGGNITGPLFLGSLAILIGGALVIINRRRATPALTASQPTITWALPPPVGVAPLLRAPLAPPEPTRSSWSPPMVQPMVQP